MVQGFGAVGMNVARVPRRAWMLSWWGRPIPTGAIVNPEGLDVGDLVATRRATGSIWDHPTGTRLERDELIGVDCDIWIPAARPHVLTLDNVERLHTRIFAQGANIPATLDAEARLHERGILSLPDFIVNAGGVICAAVEYVGGTEAQAFRMIDDRIRANTTEVLDRAEAAGSLPRPAALDLAITRLRQMMAVRKISLAAGACGERPSRPSGDGHGPIGSEQERREVGGEVREREHVGVQVDAERLRP